MSLIQAPKVSTSLLLVALLAPTLASALICMQLGLLLPPNGLLLMTMKGVGAAAGDDAAHLPRGRAFVLMSLVLLALVFVVSAVATWLPALIG